MYSDRYSMYDRSSRARSVSVISRVYFEIARYCNISRVLVYVRALVARYVEPIFMRASDNTHLELTKSDVIIVERRQE